MTYSISFYQPSIDENEVGNSNIITTFNDLENAGATLYDKMSLYLKFLRVMNLTSNFPCEGTLRTNYKKTVSKTSIEKLEKYEKAVQKIQSQKSETLQDLTLPPEPPELKLFAFLEYMSFYANYSFLEINEAPVMIEKYFIKAKPFIDQAIVCGNAKQRASYCSSIYEIIKELIPEEKKLPKNTTLNKLFGGSLKTQKGNYYTNPKNDIQPKEIKIVKQLFNRNDSSLEISKSENDELTKFINNQKDEKQKAIDRITIVSNILNIDSSDYNISDIHKGIKIKQVKPVTDRNLEPSYKAITQKYAVSINTWTRRFSTVLKGENEVEQDKLYFGSKLSTHNFGDTKKRYWQKTISQRGIPELSLMIMLDGSGSMQGDRQESAINSCVILHEVLKKQNIEHCVVDYKGMNGEDLLIHNVLLDFNSKKLDCLNLLTYSPVSGTRDGLSLLWAEKYINQNSYAKNKLIIVISDGEPTHKGNVCKDYEGETAINDSAQCVKQIQNRGTKIIGVALDCEEAYYSSFDTLKRIFMKSIKCTNLNKLTGQLLEIIAKEIR